MEELYLAYENGLLEEAFGTGTAAVISPIGELHWQERNMIINNRQTGKLTKKLYELNLVKIFTVKQPSTIYCCAIS